MTNQYNLTKLEQKKLEIIKYIEENNIEGFFTSPDISKLIDLILIKQNKNPIKFLELGSWKGKSSSIIGLTLYPGSELLCIDTFKGSEIEQDHWHKDAKEGTKVLDEFVSNMKKLREKRPDISVSYLVEDTKKAHEILENEYFDIIFVDADHRYENVKKDFFNYYPKCKKDGFIIGHDLHGGCMGIVEFVSEYYNEYKIKTYSEEESTLWLVDKLLIEEQEDE